VTGLWTIVMLVAAAVVVALTSAWRRRRALVVCGGLIIAAALTNAAGTVLFSAGAYSRYGIQEAVLLRVGAVVLLVASVDSLLGRRSPGPATARPEANDEGQDALGRRS
jgi:hypothetical protein